GISSGILGSPTAGDAATITFTVDSGVFTDNPSFPTRGYPIDSGSFALTFPSGSIGLQSPFPAGQTPYFVIRNNDPAVDGFWTSTNLSFPAGVPLGQTGSFGQFTNNYYVTYDGSTLSSLDILDALGSYDFSGLAVFNWTIDDGPFNAMGLVIASLTIEVPVADPIFRRGDANADGAFDISDAIFTLSALFSAGSPLPSCADAGDSNDDGQYDISDAIHTLAALFTPGSPLPGDPGPIDCGVDPTGDALGCADYAACP
ncbi:MAG: hypothetical protein KDC38_06590, partial [Planctomycetes bacterium]|nr:hypothetical protein [Planctomycetota bacterium]